MVRANPVLGIQPSGHSSTGVQPARNLLGRMEIDAIISAGLGNHELHETHELEPIRVIREIRGYLFLSPFADSAAIAFREFGYEIGDGVDSARGLVIILNAACLTRCVFGKQVQQIGDAPS